MPWAKDVSGTTIKFIGLSEFLGATGLVLPWGLNILPLPTPVAAAALVLVMLLAIRLHLKRKEYKEVGFNAILLVSALWWQ